MNQRSDGAQEEIVKQSFLNDKQHEKP